MSRLPPITGEGRGRSIALVAALALGQAASAGLAAFSTRDVFAAFRDDSLALPLMALGLIALAGLIIALCRIGERVVAERVGQNYSAALRHRLFIHLTEVSQRSVAERRSGALAMRFVGDLAAVRGWVSLGIARWISAGIVLPAAATTLYFLNPSLALAAALPFALGIAVMAITGPRLGPAHKRLRSDRARLAADMSERIPHAPELHLLGRTSTEEEHLARRTKALIGSALERAKGAALLRAVPDAVSGLAAASLFFVALKTGASVAETAGALAALGLMIQPLRDLAGVWDRHRAWVAARDKCLKLLSLPTLERPKSLSTAALEDRPQELVFDKAAAGCLTSIEASAPAGSMIAIVGGNGSGKSTLLSLAAGLELPTKGLVTLGGRAPAGLTVEERQRMVGLIGTRSPILAGSLRRALTLGIAKRPSDETILAKAEAFGLGEVIARLGGLDGRLAEQGRNLSAGEIRRVYLTRAALSAPRLLLLDEADDALDAEGPSLIEALLRQVDCTALVITHNLALARRLDLLWYLEDGRIREAGSPQALLEGDGPTADFFAPRFAA